MEIVFTAPLWQYDGPGGWHFLTLPREHTAALKRLGKRDASAFGSLKVTAVIGTSRWRTSLFPDNKAGAYLLPVKAAVRAAQQLRAGQPVEVLLIAATNQPVF